MKSDELDLLFDLIKLINNHLLLKYHGVFRNCPNVREELDGIKNLLGLAMDEINRLTNHD